MLFLTELFMWLFVGTVAASVFMGLSIARRLGLPAVEGWTWQIERHRWPRRWAFLLSFLLAVKALVGWQHTHQGMAFWPEWRWELALFVVLSGLFTLFTRTQTQKETSNQTEA